MMSRRKTGRDCVSSSVSSRRPLAISFLVHAGWAELATGKSRSDGGSLGASAGVCASVEVWNPDAASTYPSRLSAPVQLLFKKTILAVRARKRKPVAVRQPVVKGGDLIVAEIHKASSVVSTNFQIYWSFGSFL